jgi:hypothetical protein
MRPDFLQVPLVKEIVKQEIEGLCAIAPAPGVLFWQADTDVDPFGLLIQKVEVDPANVLAFYGIDLPRGSLWRTTATFGQTFIEFLSTCVIEWYVRLVVVVPLFEIEPTEEILIIGLSLLIS